MAWRSLPLRAAVSGALTVGLALTLTPAALAAPGRVMPGSAVVMEAEGETAEGGGQEAAGTDTTAPTEASGSADATTVAEADRTDQTLVERATSERKKIGKLVGLSTELTKREVRPTNSRKGPSSPISAPRRTGCSLR